MFQVVAFLFIFQFLLCSSPKTRFRWLQESVTVRGNVWALDNIYLGEGCPWMCSGHGRCSQDTCMYDILMMNLPLLIY